MNRLQSTIDSRLKRLQLKCLNNSLKKENRRICEIFMGSNGKKQQFSSSMSLLFASIHQNGEKWGKMGWKGKREKNIENCSTLVKTTRTTWYCVSLRFRKCWWIQRKNRAKIQGMKSIFLFRECMSNVQLVYAVEWEIVKIVT